MECIREEEGSNYSKKMIPISRFSFFKECLQKFESPPVNQSLERRV